MLLRTTAVAAMLAACLLGFQASASQVAAITIEAHDPQAFARDQAALANRRVETFESIATGERFGALNTQVGRFETLGGTGSGSTVTGTSGNTGTGLYLRDRATHGRVNTTAGGARFLDSNDTYGMRWDISGIGFFDRIMFTLGDLGDAGGKLTISHGKTKLTKVFSGRANGLVDMVTIQFAAAVDAAELSFRMSRLNDGFSIDDATVGTYPSAVPLPPALLLLGAAVAGLTFLRRQTRNA